MAEALEETIEAVVRGLCRASSTSRGAGDGGGARRWGGGKRASSSVATATGARDAAADVYINDDDDDDDDEGVMDYARETAALDDELEAIARALDSGTYGFGRRWGSRGDEGRASESEAEAGTSRERRRMGKNPEPEAVPELWNARFVTDVVGRAARGGGGGGGDEDEMPDFDAVDGGEKVDDASKNKGGKGFAPKKITREPSSVGLFAASIPMVSERVISNVKGGQTMSERLEDIVTRVDIARALIAEARDAMKHTSAVACMSEKSAKMTADAARAKLKSKRRQSNI